MNLITQEQVMAFHQSFHGNPELWADRVLMEKMPDCMIETIKPEFKACYKNIFNAFTRAPWASYDLRYVVGRADSIMPMDHAWLKIGSYHYDPTWQRFSDIGSGYYPIAELTRSELLAVIDGNSSRPPSAAEVALKFPELCTERFQWYNRYLLQEAV